MNVQLNKKQNQVVEELDSNILLIASAGTGKTNTLSYRISNILENKKALPEEILCLTFTNRACKEMIQRISQTVGDISKKIVIKTFHGFCYDIIKSEAKISLDINSDFIIYDETDTEELLVELEPGINPRLAKDRAQGMSSSKGLICDAVIQDRYETYMKNIKDPWFLNYNAELKVRNALDFGDLTINTLLLFKKKEVLERWKNKFKYILVDEVQDTDEHEYYIISKFFEKNNVMMCGDFFQTIYEWRGSNPDRIIDEFVKTCSPKTIVFDENYRSTQILLDASFEYLKNTFMFDVNKYYPDGIKAKSSNYGEKIKFKAAENFDDEAKWILEEILKLNVKDLSKIAVLTRGNRINNELSKSFNYLKHKLDKENKIKFLLVDDFKFFHRMEIKDITAYFKLIMNRFDISSLKRIIKKFVHGVGDKTIEFLESSKNREIGIKLTDFIDKNMFIYGDVYQLLFNELEKKNVVVFDVESTGTDTSYDDIVQIAAVKIDGYGNVIKTFEKFLIPAKSVGTSEKVHGFSDEYLKIHGEPSKKILGEFSEFIKDTLVVGHNVTYDISIFTSQCAREKLPQPEFIDFYDTLDIARRFYPALKNHKLETLSKLFDTSTKSSHNALDDVLATKDVLINMLNDKVKPTTLKRMQVYGKYKEKFLKLCTDYYTLKDASYKLRPYELMTEVIKSSEILKLYEKEPQRYENVKEFYYIVKDMDKGMSCRDELLELLKTTSLSNSELDRMLEKNPRIPIITIHQAKGCEFDYVFLAGLQDYVFPTYNAIWRGDLSEEERIFYVGITRAKKRLYLSYAKKDAKGDKNKSRLIEQIPENYINFI